MKNRNLAIIATSTLLTGCGPTPNEFSDLINQYQDSLEILTGKDMDGQDSTDHTNKTVKFGNYSLDSETFDFIQKESYSPLSPSPFEEYIHFFKGADKNKDLFITHEEAEKGFEGLAALVAPLK